MIRECRIDLWQLRSHRTRSPRATVPCQTILFAVEVPPTTKSVSSEPKMRAALRSPSAIGPGVVEERAKLADRHRDVGAQRVLAEEFVELLPDRAFAEGDAAAMSWRVPRVAGLIGIIHQRLEHRRRQIIEVELRRADDHPRYELGRVLVEPHESVGVPQDAGGYHLRRQLVAKEEDRKAVVAASLGGKHLFQNFPFRGRVF